MPSYLQWGRAAFICHRRGEAEERFRQALEREPGSSRAAHGLALCLEGSGRRSEAADFLRAFVKPDETFTPLLHRFGRTLAAEGAREEALPWLRWAWSVPPTGSSPSRSGLLLNHHWRL